MREQRRGRPPWEDDSFDVVTGFSAFQFADDKVRALSEARRVSRGRVVVVISTRVPESGITSVFKPIFPLFSAEALESMEAVRLIIRRSEVRVLPAPRGNLQLGLFPRPVGGAASSHLRL